MHQIADGERPLQPARTLPEKPDSGHPRDTPSRAFTLGYIAVLGLSIAVWFTALRAPLWLDETISFWQIRGGFSQIVSRSRLMFSAYAYVLWLFTKVLGTSEVSLRIPSILAMLAAVYLLYRAARELFPRDIALTACIIFSTHPIVIYTSIDARPYAFAVLAANVAIFVLVRVRRSDSRWLPSLLGIAAALILYFHIIYTVIIPALAISFVFFKIHDRPLLINQSAAAVSSFALASAPLIPGFLYIFHTRATHPFDRAPTGWDLIPTIAPFWVVFFFGLAALLSTITRYPFSRRPVDMSCLVLCTSLGLIPILILYAVSVTTPLHIFVDRYRLVAIPGIALCWALLVSRINSRAVRIIFCLPLAMTIAYYYFTNPEAKTHNYTWKYALQFAEKNASADNVPVVMCSDLTESNFMSMPLENVKDSPYFSPLAYYQLSVPVIPLPRGLNDEAIRVASAFLQDAADRHERFLAVAYKPSYPTLHWLGEAASRSHSSRLLGTFDGIEVMEFTPSSVRYHTRPVKP